MSLMKRVILVFVFIFCLNFVLAADASLRINTYLSSVDIQGRFSFETDPSSSSGIDSNDLGVSTDYSNYSILSSSSNLMVDSRPSGSSSEINLIYYTEDNSQEGEVTLSWSYSNSNYPLIFSYYGTDSSRTNVIANFSMDNISDYSFDFDSAPHYFTLSYTYVPDPATTPTGGSCTSSVWSPDPSTVCNGSSFTQTSNCGTTRSAIGTKNCCVDSTWTDVTNGACISGLEEVTQISNCGLTQTISRACCVPSVMFGDWQTCRANNTQIRSVQTTSEGENGNCVRVDTTQEQACVPGCVEDWSDCQWSSSCINGFLSVSNCIDKNSCGTTNSRPSPLPCTVELDGRVTVTTEGGGSLAVDPNCKLELTCEEWSSCNVQNGLEDLKNNQGNLDGFRVRKCTDKNSCLKAPYIEQEKCSLKVFIQVSKEKICGQDYLAIYKEGTKDLLAMILDGRNTSRRSITIRFILDGGKVSFACDEFKVGEYLYTNFDKVMSLLDVRKLWRIFA